MKHYQTMVLEDKNKPLFSQTSKYNSFPNPQPFGSSNNGGKHRNHGNQTARHKIVITRGGATEEGTGRVKWNSGPVSEIEKARHGFVTILNKINKSNLQEIFQELMNHLQQSPYFELYQSIYLDLYQKLLLDKNYHEYYMKIVSLLCKFKKFYESFVRCEKKEDGYYYTLRYFKTPEKVEWIGPFASEYQLYDAVFNKYNLKGGMIRMCEREFKNRWKYVEEMKKEKEEDRIMVWKRKIMTPLEIMISMYEQKLVQEKVLFMIVGDLMKPHSETGVYEEELFYGMEMFFGKKYFGEDDYEMVMKKVEEWLTMKWSKRCQFYLEGLKKKVEKCQESGIFISPKKEMTEVVVEDIDWEEIVLSGYKQKTKEEWKEWKDQYYEQVCQEQMKEQPTFWVYWIQFGLEDMKHEKRMNELMEEWKGEWEKRKEVVLEYIREECLKDWEIDAPGIEKRFSTLIC